LNNYVFTKIQLNVNFINVYIRFYNKQVLCIWRTLLFFVKNLYDYNQSILEGLIRAMPQLTERNQLM